VGDGTMKKLHSPSSELDAMFIKSLLEAEDIYYFVHNDYFGSLNIGPVIPLFNEKTIYVAERDAKTAGEVISAYLDDHRPISKETERVDSSYNLSAKIRIIVEVLLFNWFIPPIKTKH
jgi:heptaprenylglyceryl phosphate synthase